MDEGVPAGEAVGGVDVTREDGVDEFVVGSCEGGWETDV
jgi:hypothetical protein